MRTQDIVSNLSRGCLVNASLDAASQHSQIHDARQSIDAFVSAKQLSPLDSAAKLSRLGHKVVEAATQLGCPPHRAVSYANALGLPLQMRGVRAPSFEPASVAQIPPVADRPHLQAATDPFNVTFQAADGAVVVMSRSLIDNVGPQLLRRMLEGSYGDMPSIEGHMQLPIVPKRQLELVARFMQEPSCLTFLSDPDLALARTAALVCDYDVMLDGADEELRRRRPDCLLNAEFLQHVEKRFGASYLAIAYDLQEKMEICTLRTPRKAQEHLEVSLGYAAEDLVSYSLRPTTQALRLAESFAQYVTLSLLRANCADVSCASEVVMSPSRNIFKVAFTWPDIV